MVSYLLTSSSAINRVVESLKIPTVRPTKLIKIEPEKLKILLSNPDSFIEVKQEPIFHSDIEINSDHSLLSEIKQEAIDFDLNLEDVDLTKTLNNSEILDLNFFHTVPSTDNISEGILTSNQIFESLGYNEKEFENLLIEIPQNTKLEEEPARNIQNEYKSIFRIEGRKRRKKNVYRAEDITNEEDLVNYLERRKKNNFSSKCSRANKKKYYNELDANCDNLEIENEVLKKKQAKLIQINELLKEYLVENYSKTT